MGNWTQVACFTFLISVACAALIATILHDVESHRRYGPKRIVEWDKTPIDPLHPISETESQTQLDKQAEDQTPPTTDDQAGTEDTNTVKEPSNDNQPVEDSDSTDTTEVVPPVVFEPHLTIHLIPHTHNDAGWRKTFEQYYDGSNESMDGACVKTIITSVVDTLTEDPDRRFVYADMGFFTRWWKDQDETMKEKTRKVVANRQLEFVNGGWVSQDEATTYYHDILDNMANGHKFLYEQFGVRPTIGWLVDSFGHSSANADLYAKIGLDAMFFCRIDYQDMENRRKNLEMEFVWKPKEAVGPTQGIFTHVMHNMYIWPKDFSLDARSDFRDTLSEWNIESKARQFIDYVRDMSKSYRADHLMLAMGHDFSYMYADYNFGQLEMLIDAVNKAGRNVTCIFSTPNTYIDAIASLEEIQWPEKADDFFPYADRLRQYWTGFYTSRPTHKLYYREAGRIVRAHQNQLAEKILKGKDEEVANMLNRLFELSQEVSVLQHHDAMTGTEQQYVAEDYKQRISSALGPIQLDRFSTIRNKLKTSSDSQQELFECPLSNISVCEFEPSSNSFTLVLYNPTFRSVKQLVKMPLNWNGADVIAIEAEAQKIPSQVIANPFPVIDKSKEGDYKQNLLYFVAQLSSMETKAYKIAKTQATNPLAFSSCNSTCSLETSTHMLQISDNTELWTLTTNELSYTIKPSIAYYKSRDYMCQGGNCSGAYIFGPKSSDVIDYPVTAVTHVQGNVVGLVYVEYDGHANQLFTLPVLSCDNDYLHVTTHINSINVSDNQGKDVVFRLAIDLNSKSQFFTDSNGLYQILREWDKRESWNLDNSGDPIASNVYPITTSLFIQDHSKDNKDSECRVTKRSISFLSDRAQAVSAQSHDKETVAEIMVHRRLLQDDARGVSQPLNEKEPTFPYNGIQVVTNHGIILGRSERYRRMEENAINNPVQMYFSNMLCDAITPNSSARELPEGFVGLWRIIDTNNLVLRVEYFGTQGATFAVRNWVENQTERAFKLGEIGLSENLPAKMVRSTKPFWNVTDESRIVGTNYMADSPEALFDDLLKESNVHFEPYFSSGEIKAFLVRFS